MLRSRPVLNAPIHNSTWDAPVKPKTTQPSPLTQQYNLYNNAVKQQAGDYDRIMQGYRDLPSNDAYRGYQNMLSGPAMQGFTSLLSNLQSGGQANFQNTDDARASISNLGELARTGGLSERDQANIRERGISPIRSVYANAQRDVNRQKALSGGYSPNHGAVTSKMAREMSEQLAGQSTKVNADLAEMVQRGRLSAASPYAQAAGGERDAMNQFEMFNKRDLPQYQLEALKGMSGIQSNALQGMQGIQSESLGGQKSLYGTTPALSSLFGDQAMSAAQLQNMISQQNKGSNVQVLGQMLGGMR
jgi:hypothetical protein